MSPDHGETWYDISSGFQGSSFPNVMELTIGSDKHLYAIVQHVNSIYKSTNATIVGLEKPTLIEGFNIQVFPNPFSSKLMIILNNNFFGYCNVSFFNIRGEIVLAKNNVAIANGKILMTIPEELPVGMYLLKIELDKHIATKKIIKS